MKKIKEIARDIYDIYTSLLYELDYETVEELHTGEDLLTREQQIAWWSEDLGCYYPLTDDEATDLDIHLSNLLGNDDRFDSLSDDILTEIIKTLKK